MKYARCFLMFGIAMQAIAASAADFEQRCKNCTYLGKDNDGAAVHYEVLSKNKCSGAGYNDRACFGVETMVGYAYSSSRKERGITYSRLIDIVVFDCASAQSLQESTTYYDEKGEWLASATIQSPQFRSHAEGTTERMVQKAVC